MSWQIGDCFKINADSADYYKVVRVYSYGFGNHAVVKSMPEGVEQVGHLTPAEYEKYVHIPDPAPFTESGDTQKKDAGKLRFDLIPPGPLAELAKVYTIGAAKYADNGWKAGMQWGRVYAAMCRHLFKWWCGEKYDHVDGQHHLSAVAWGCFTLMWYEENNKGEDDRDRKQSAITLGVADNVTT